ncbi:hypothetical protein [Streptomyces sp. NBC_00989]|uniref:hypothetical protein n=1 Tax=Streptomyces sp. NBC_00989 TaxID=2903705 RepID=UPI00386321D4|nr:hypothetical protein OG714_29210 [Streptomyces sp. NBC_00989]
MALALTRTPRKRAFSDRDRRTLHERLVDCAHNPDLAFLFFLAARSVPASARRTAAHLQHPEVWTILKAGVRAELGAAEAARRAAVAAPTNCGPPPAVSRKRSTSRTEQRN